jgi:hypothetical protein
MTTYAQKYLNQSEKGYWKYGSIYISLTNICTFLYITQLLWKVIADKDNVVR